MVTCSCGRESDDAGKPCARCAALQALDLDWRATDQQIRDAYRVLVKVWHPDRFQSDPALRQAAEAKLKALNVAYVLLTAKDGGAHRPRRPRPAARPVQAHQYPRVRPLARFHFPAATFIKLAVLAGGVLVSGAFLMAMDSFFASDPATGRIYSEIRAHVVANARETAGTVWSQAGRQIHELLPQKSEPSPAAAAFDPAAQPADPQPASAQNGAGQSASQSLHRREPGDARAQTLSLQPYITAGLTRDEVIAVLGAPTSSTDGKLVYGASELDFTAGRLSGWKIADASPIRVKLWPDAPVDPDLAAFKLGSSKNEVLVAQGTPTLFSQDTFGYGGSRVFFKNNRVVGWKNDPATVPLHIAP